MTLRLDPMISPATTDQATSHCDTSLRFVKVLERRADGLVSFEFSIGWPELAVELLLPAAAFAEFCTSNKVIRLEPRANDDDRHPQGDTTP